MLQPRMNTVLTCLYRAEILTKNLNAKEQLGNQSQWCSLQKPILNIGEIMIMSGILNMLLRVYKLLYDYIIKC